MQLTFQLVHAEQHTGYPVCGMSDKQGEMDRKNEFCYDEQSWIQEDRHQHFKLSNFFRFSQFNHNNQNVIQPLEAEFWQVEYILHARN